KPRQVRRAVRQGIWAIVTVCVPLMVLLWNIAPILHLTGQDPALIPLTELYVQAVLWALMPMAGIIVLRSFVSAFGQARIVLMITLVALPLNALLDYALIFGNFGLPQLGIAGSGYATSIITVSMFSVLALVCARGRPFRKYAIWVRFWKPDWSVYLATFRLGLPIALTLLMEVGLFVAGIYLIGTIDPAQVAGTQIALQLASISFMVPLGIGQAATIRIGLAAGQHAQSHLRSEGMIAAGLGLAFMAAMGLVFWVGNQSLAALFLDETDVMAITALAYGALFLQVAAIFQLFDGLQVIALSALRGLNDTRIPMLLAFLAYWLIGFPTAWVLAFAFGLEGLGVWIGLATALATAAVLLSWRFIILTRPTTPAITISANELA
ncbi:MAG: MATE family efflux transporter, partial [Pseudomonadota bacterium]